MSRAAWATVGALCSALSTVLWLACRYLHPDPTTQAPLTARFASTCPECGEWYAYPHPKLQPAFLGCHFKDCTERA